MKSCQRGANLLRKSPLIAGTFFVTVFALVLGTGEEHTLGQRKKQALPEKHPIVAKEDTRDDLSNLTDNIAPHLKGGASPHLQRQNFIDDYIFGKMERESVPHAPLSTDEEFFRRIHLDLWGRIPSSDDVKSFLQDASLDKRERLIERMLALDYDWEDLSNREGYDSADPAISILERQMNEQGPWLVNKAFLARWSYWFSDLFRNSRAYLLDGRNAFYEYIYDSLQYNVPYNRFVIEMFTATALLGRHSGPANLLLRDHVDDTVADGFIVHEDTLDEIAISTAKYFLGIDLECVSCHDGAGHVDKMNLWLSRRKRPELWRQAAFFGNIRIMRAGLQNNNFTLLEGPPLMKYRQFHDGGHGYDTQARSVLRPPRFKTNVSPRFVLNGEEPNPDKGLREEFARILTSHPQFSKATVNLIWAELMGVGIVDPPFGWDPDRQDPDNPPPSPWKIQPTHPKLLEALAENFKQSGFDLRELMALITKSSAYQLSSRFHGKWNEGYARYYARRPVRRLPAEVIFDAVCQSTGIFDELQIYGTSKVVNFVLETYSSEDIQDVELKRFLHYFGQSERKVDAPLTGGSIIQASLLVNSDIIKKRVLTSTKNSTVNKLLKQTPVLSNEKIVEELFLATLSRFPTEAEKNLLVKHLREHRDFGAEDVQWALLNKLEFLFNY